MATTLMVLTQRCSAIEDLRSTPVSARRSSAATNRRGAASPKVRRGAGFDPRSSPTKPLPECRAVARHGAALTEHRTRSVAVPASESQISRRNPSKSCICAGPDESFSYREEATLPIITVRPPVPSYLPLLMDSGWVLTLAAATLLGVVLLVGALNRRRGGEGQR